ncbi:MAG: type II toxin-antitoxin system RelE/ParE family toxin [Gallionella sp.]|jgi:plasmid stabilization system protein ParE
MQFVLRPEAAQELLDAQAWYEAQIPGLGFEFARMADAAIASVLRNPLSYQRIEGEFRRVPLRRFPYVLIYLPTPNELLVVSCFHQRREPVSWLSKIKG